MKPIVKTALAALITALAMPAYSITHPPCGSGAGKVKDEALCANRSADSLKGADDDYFVDMDYGASKDPEALARLLDPYVPGISPKDAHDAVVRGRNNWIVWTAGNDKFWDGISKTSVGTLDFLKVLSNHPSLKFSRDNRWDYLGLVNEPCFKKSAGPRADRFGLWLDERSADCAADPFEDEKKYPGVEIGARGKTVPVGSYYGYATGIVGLRLFPNPDFDEKAAKAWDPEKFYKDESYYNNKDLVRPYRVGMSCGFCHVGPNPSNPPSDPENPKWENLNSNPGAQYFWIDRIFSYDADPSSFPYQLFHTSRPGALDTSLVSTDYINNPRTMNAVYSLGARMSNALKFGQEKLAGGGLNNKQFNELGLPASSPLNSFFKAPATVWTPRVLKDGADSVGALGALNRVFVNIGLFSEEWTEHFRPLVGGKKISPFPIATARKNSSYWLATEAQTPDLALFFLATAQPDYLSKAPGGDKFLKASEDTMKRGKDVFAETCARCHSSKLPEKAYSFFPNGCVGSDYLGCWDKYWKWTKTDEFKTEMKAIVAKEDFLKDNFLSTELRVPVSLLQTNACSPLATNGLANNIWDNFTSQSYKDLPSVGKYTVHHPITGAPYDYTLPGGGRGFTRPASLISVWSTAPYLLNNSLGKFYASGSVEDRMKSFDDSIHQLLWPEKRSGNRDIVVVDSANPAERKVLKGQVDVTTTTSYLRIPKGYLPDLLQPLVAPFSLLKPWAFDKEGVEIGPIPKGTPVNLISNMDLDPSDPRHVIKLIKVLKDVKKALKAIPPGASDAEAIKVFDDRNIVDDMLSVSKCPDFVVNRGHYFGTDYLAEEKDTALNDADKEALIELLKTF
ncbi:MULTISPECIES: hypothetical protein [Methylomonas]|uniref:hypothetical protein n=1 Tax=Methylomonas TaxID=416 RepID=UPI001231ED9B|nr:hypothetical protein [Methylomonas rhizoryzae]